MEGGKVGQMGNICNSVNNKKRKLLFEKQSLVFLITFITPKDPGGAEIISTVAEKPSPGKISIPK